MASAPSISGLSDSNPPSQSRTRQPARQELPSAADRGALVIEDTFKPSPELGGLAHGDLVKGAAQQTGFQGKIFERTAPLQAPENDQYRAANDLMHQSGLPRDQFLKAFRDRTSSDDISFLRDQTAELNRLRQSGFHDGAVNYSQGSSKENDVSNDIRELRQSLHPADSATADEKQRLANLSDNYGRAFGVEPAKLAQESKEGHEQWSKLEQGVVDQVNQARDGNTDLKQAKSDYDQASARLARKNVSIAVAGENGGRDMARFAQLGNGTAPKIPADYYQNPLSNSSSLTVGATGSLQSAPGAKEAIAPYNSPVKDSVLADGRIGFGGQAQQGTSFATPRVAATLAQLHGDYPDNSNKVVEGALLHDTTHPQKIAPSLDAAKLRQLFSGY